MIDHKNIEIKNLAIKFSEVLHRHLDDHDIKQIIRINHERNGTDLHGSCASHDFCDPNEYMTIAFREVFADEQRYITTEDDFSLVNEAWEMASINDFWHKK
jgi:hypothetical protein